MKTARVCVALAVAWCMQVGVAHAYVDFWDRLSGPGPFVGFVIPYRFLCVSQGSDQARFRQPPGASTQPDETFATWIGPFDAASNFIPVRTPPSGAANAREQARLDCLHDERLRGYSILTTTFFGSTSNRLFPSDPDNSRYGVRITHVEWAYAIRLHDTLDVSAAVGFSRFSGEVFDPFWRPSLTPIVVRFAPLAFKWPNQKGRSLKIALGLVTHFDGFDAADFCNIDAVTCANVDTSFRSNRERILRVGVEINPVWFR